MTELNQAQLEAIVRRYRELNSMVAEFQGEMQELKQQFEEATTVGFKLTVDGKSASHRPPNRSFSLVAAMGVLTPDQKRACIVTQYDDKKIRAKVEAAGLLEECMLIKEDAAPIVSLG